MGWGRHPDTMAIAGAKGEADRSGHDPKSLQWLKAYRAAYEDQNRGDGLASLDDYLANLDRRIAKLIEVEETSSEAPR